MRKVYVRFMANQNAEDLFCCVDNKNKVYCRQPSNNPNKVIWLTTSKWSGGYEASSPIRSDIEIVVVDKNYDTIFTERNNYGEFADKVYPFSYEQIKNIASLLSKKYKLKDYYYWKNTLLRAKFNYEKLNDDKFSDDNWLYRHWEELDSMGIDTFYIYKYKRLRLSKSEQIHKLCNKKWYEYNLVEDDDTVAELVGYEF